MDFFYMVLGLGMIYVWVHFFVTVFKRYSKMTKYEQFLAVTSAVLLTLVVFGTM